MSNTGEKYISRISAKGKCSYRILKFKNGKSRSFGTFKNLDEAIKRRNFLIEQDWDNKYMSERKHDNYVDEEFIFKNTIQNNTYYVLGRTVDGENKRFGYYKTLEEAIKGRDYYIRNGWRKEFRRYDNSDETKYITLVNGKYIIQKWIDGNLESFDKFDTLEEAQHERDLLVKYDWNYTAMVEGEGT